MYPGHIFLALLALFLCDCTLGSASSEEELRLFLRNICELHYYDLLKRDRVHLTPCKVQAVHLLATSHTFQLPPRTRHLVEKELERKERQILVGRKWISGLLQELNTKSRGILRNPFEGPFVSTEQEQWLAQTSSHSELSQKYLEMLAETAFWSTELDPRIHYFALCMKKAQSIGQKFTLLEENWKVFWTVDHKYSSLYIHLLAYAISHIQHETYACQFRTPTKTIFDLWGRFNIQLREFYPILICRATKVIELPVGREFILGRSLIRIPKCHVFLLPGASTYSVLVLESTFADPQSPADFVLKSPKLAATPHIVIYASHLTDARIANFRIFLCKFFSSQMSPLDIRLIADFLNKMTK